MIDLKEGDSFMNGLLLLGLSALILVVAYLFYGRYLVKTWGIDPKATTPAVAKEDGTDFVPTNKWSVFAHQFSSIAGAGPVTGPVMAMMFGWLPAFLWVIVGGVFFGAVQDFDRERIYELVWGLDGDGNSDTIMEHIRKIRAKFAAHTLHNYIETVWGCGYRWNA